MERQFYSRVEFRMRELFYCVKYHYASKSGCVNLKLFLSISLGAGSAIPY